MVQIFHVLEGKFEVLLNETGFSTDSRGTLHIKAFSVALQNVLQVSFVAEAFSKWLCVSPEGSGDSPTEAI